MLPGCCYSCHGSCCCCCVVYFHKEASQLFKLYVTGDTSQTGLKTMCSCPIFRLLKIGFQLGKKALESHLRLNVTSDAQDAAHRQLCVGVAVSHKPSDHVHNSCLSTCLKSRASMLVTLVGIFGCCSQMICWYRCSWACCCLKLS